MLTWLGWKFTGFSKGNSMKEKIGVIDLGTNTFHLLIAEFDKGSLSVIHRERQAVKLGMGGINQGLILDEAAERGIKCLLGFKEKLEKENVQKIKALGTSALRSAANGQQVIDLIKTRTGITVEIISGDQEAEYIYYGVRSAVELGNTHSLIVDIGGGSVEFIIASPENILWKASLDIGAQRMLERFHQHDPILKEELEALNQHYVASLISVEKAMSEFHPNVLVGSSGTFDTLSEIFCQNNRLTYHSGQPETPLTVEGFRTIHTELISKSRADRLKIPGMIEMRVDMIVVASCLIRHLIDRFDFQKVRVSSYSLKEGVLASLTAGRKS
jgi:exopolyphosphatase/guanosine-5'-triphosphate,3'-diphosphate pyrophosphatase